MFVVGYVYTSNPARPGFRPEKDICATEKEAQALISKKLAGKTVSFEEGEGKTRAFADESSTNWLYFEIKVETWALLDPELMGSPRRKAVLGTGTLDQMKTKARKVLEKDLKDRSQTLISFDTRRTGDNVSIEYRKKDYDYNLDSGLKLVRVS
jgi:hypothetical protein